MTPPQNQSKTDSNNVTKAVKSLQKWWNSKSKNDDGFVYLIVTLKKPPHMDRTNPTLIPIPHPLIDLTVESPDLCLIIDDKHKANKITKEFALKRIESENIPISDVIKVSRLKTDLIKLEKEEGKRFEFFFTERRLLPVLPKLLGKKNIPISINLRYGNWKEEVERVCESALFFVGNGTCSVVKVAKLSMGKDEIVENVVAAMDGVVGSIPGKWKNVRFFHVKLTESLALPVYQSVKDKEVVVLKTH